ncbi:MAG: class I SAM-dependent methyltransferase [Gammaproteobacteria bacterium]|nr:class I SAM-dependent methyltransferase [Gammaproteobacteria bacterium]
MNAVRAYCQPQGRWLLESIAAGLCVEERSQQPEDVPGFYLWAVDDHVELCRGADPGVWITAQELRRRTVQGSELLRACGVSAAAPPRVLDAMAGWGVDALVLAGRGCRVTLVERHPALCVLAQDLARRSGLTRLVGGQGDGYQALCTPGPYDVVYLDPMFPLRNKGALPGKRMQWLAQLAGADPRPLHDWLQQAVAKAAGRVVLKRRRTDPPVAAPDWQIAGRTVRYDVYRGRGGP